MSRTPFSVAWSAAFIYSDMTLRSFSLLLAALSALLLNACKPAPLNADLANYVTHTLPGYTKLERAAMDMFLRVSGDNFDDDATLYETLQQRIIPSYTELIAQAESAIPATIEVRHLHDNYLLLLRCKLAAFALYATSMVAQDPENLASANAALDECEQRMRDFDKRLAQFCAEQSVQLPKTEDAH